MRPFTSVLVAGAIALFATLPAQAAMKTPSPVTTMQAGSGIEQISDSYYYRNYGGQWRPRHHSRRHGYHGFFPRHGGFYFNFPFPRPYAYYHRRPRCHDLVLGYDGRWHCYRGW